MEAVGAMPYMQQLPQSIATKITPGKEVIISVFPSIMTLETQHAGMYKYYHPPCQRDKVIILTNNVERTTLQPAKEGPPFFYQEQDCEMGEGFTMIEVFDTYQITRDWTIDNEVYINRPILAGGPSGVAVDLVKCWTSGRFTESASGGPGIRVYDAKRDLNEQLAELRAHQSVYFRDLIHQADEFSQRSEMRNITNLHRMAADWEGVKDRKWFEAIQAKATKSCPGCGETINANAIICKHCNVNIIIFAEDMLARGVEITDPVLGLYKQVNTPLDLPETPLVKRGKGKIAEEVGN